MIMTASTTTLNLDLVRREFPALAGEWTFFDNAGGSQTLQRVVDRIGEYLLTSDVQLGASYGVSQLAGDRVARGVQSMADYINAADPCEVVIGSSTSALLRMLSICLGRTLSPGDEVIVTNSDHEANISPWVDLKRKGIVIKTWSVNPETLHLHLDDLEALITDRTRLVTLTHASNILGTINPVKEITQFIHDRGAMVCVDGVGYAAHRLIDVQDWDVDFYVFSAYKVYGPHQAVLYGKREHLLRIPGINHYFIPETEIPYKFLPGNMNYELTYSLTGLVDYFNELAQKHGCEGNSVRDRLSHCFTLIADHEEQLGEHFLAYLRSQPRVRIIGNSQADQTQRVPTIAFVVDGVDSATIPPQVDPHKIGIRYGDFYARRLVEDLGLTATNGVVRVSMVHYNTIAEVDRLISCLQTILPG